MRFERGFEAVMGGGGGSWRRSWMGAGGRAREGVGLSYILIMGRVGIAEVDVVHLDSIFHGIFAIRLSIANFIRNLTI